MENTISSIILIKKIIRSLAEVIKFYDQFDKNDPVAVNLLKEMKSRDVDNILILSNLLEDYYYGSEEEK